VEVGETQTLIVESIQMGRLDDRISVDGQLWIALVIGHDDDDIGFRSPRRRGVGAGEEQTAREEYE